MIAEEPLRRWLIFWHGRGGPEQHDYYRCDDCKRLVTHKAIRKGGCVCGGAGPMGPKLRPARLSWGEKARLLFMPWSVLR